MKFRNIMLVACLLLTILTIGAVSAFDDNLTAGNLSQIDENSLDNNVIADVEIISNAVDLSNTTVESYITFTDLGSGETYSRNITAGPVKSDYILSKPENSSVDAMIDESIRQVLGSNQAYVIKNKTVSGAIKIDQFNNITYNGNPNYPTEPPSSGSLVIEGVEYTVWLYKATLNVEYNSKVPSYLFAFDSNGGNGAMSNVLLMQGSIYVLPQSNYTRTHYNFRGWNVSGELRQPGENITANENMTITPVWEINSVIDNSMDTSEILVVATITLKDSTGVVYTKNITSNPIQASYDKPRFFNESKENYYKMEIIHSQGQNFTYAIPQVYDLVNRAISQLLADAQGVAGNRTLVVKSKFVSNEIFANRADNRTYSFVNVDSEKVLLIEGNYSSRWEYDVVLDVVFANESEICNLTFDANGGSGEMSDVLIYQSDIYTLPECSFTRSKHNFAGWWVYDSLKSPGDNITVTGNATVKAIWMKTTTSLNVLDVSFDDSMTKIVSKLILTDTKTGEIHTIEITSDPIACNLTNAASNESVKLMTDSMILLLKGIAHKYAGESTVIFKNLTISDVADIAFNDDYRGHIYYDSSDPYLEGWTSMGEPVYSLGNRLLVLTGGYLRIWNYNLTLEAEITDDVLNCSIVFNSTDGEGSMADVTVRRGTTFTLPECAFIKADRTFYGWNVGDAIKKPGENITVSDNITIKTVWMYNVNDNIISGNSKILNNATDESTTSIEGMLVLTDLRTGKISTENITVGPVKSNYTSPIPLNVSIDDMINDTVNQLLRIAQIQANGKYVTIKNQTLLNVSFTEGDNRTFSYHYLYEGANDLLESVRFLQILGSYYALWTYPVLLVAEYESEMINIAEAKLTVSKTAFTYNAKVQKPSVTLTNGVVLKEGVDYTLKWSSASPKNAGTYVITVTGTGDYNGTVKATFKINKASNTLKVSAKTVTLKFSKLKKKAQTLAVSKVVKFVKKGQGTLTYVKVTGNKKISINKKNGKVTVKKGLKKGTYKVKVKVKAAGNANYKASAYKTVTFVIKIK